MNTSRPRTFSMISILTSPSLKRPTDAPPIGCCRWRAMSCASAGFAFPVNNASVSDSTISASWSDHHCRSLVAGVEGFEPPNGGIKTRCLTTWRHPSSPSLTPRSSTAHPQHRMQRRMIQSAHDKAAPPVRNPSGDTLRILGARGAGEDTRAGAGQARRDRRPVRIDLRGQPPQRLRHLRPACAYYWFKDVDGVALRKGAYCDDGRISCQFRGLEQLRGTHADARVNHQKPARRQLHWGQPLPATLAPGRTAVNKHRYVRAERKSQLRQLRDAQIALPQGIERQQHGGRIRATPSQAAAGRNR